MAENQVYLIKSGQNSFVEETQAIVGISGGKVGIGTTVPESFFHVAGDTQIDGDLTVKGNFTTVDSTTIQVDDKNIELGVGSTTDAAADGGGITLKGATDKTFNWVDATDAWTSSEHLHLDAGKHFAADDVRALGAGGLSIGDDAGNGIFIEDGGKIGIGTTNPAYDLDVNGSGNFDSLYIQGNSVLTGDGSIFGKWEDAATDGEIYYNGGNVGVGVVDPSAQLHVVGTTLLNGDVSASTIKAIDANGLNLGDDAGNGIFVKDGGQIGINITSPNYNLHVNGSTHVGGEFSVGSEFKISAGGAIGGTAPASDGDIIRWDDANNKWIAGANLGGGGGGGVGEVPLATINSLPSGQSIYEIEFAETYNVEPRIATQLEIDGEGSIIPYVVSGVSTSGYHLIFAQDIPNNNYRIHTTFGGRDVHWETGSSASLYYNDGDVSVQRNFTIGGNLTVNGTTTTVNTETVEIEDHNLVIAANTGYNQLDSQYPAGGAYAGILWGTGDAGAASPVSLTYQTNKGFAFAGGNVGIGTTNPLNKLHITADNNDEYDASSYASAALQIKNTNTTASSPHSLIHFRLDKNGGDGYLGFTTDGSTANTQHFVLGNQGTGECFRIKSNGNVGIGTTDPSAKLEVFTESENTGIQYGNINDSLLLKNKSDTAGAGPKLVFYNSANEGSGSPSALIGLQRVDNTDETTTGTNRGNLVFWTRGTVNPEARMLIDSNGNVGIGTTNPSANLEVCEETGSPQLLINNAGTSFNAASIKFLSGGTGNPVSLIESGGTNSSKQGLFFSTGLETGSVSTQMVIDSTGNVGIGTTNPDAGLHVFSSGNGEIEVERSSGAKINLQAQSAFAAIGTKSNHDFGIKANSAVVMRLTTSGRVGIGTTNPNSKLQVETASDNVYADSNRGTNFALILKNTPGLDGASAGNNVGIAFYNHSTGNNFNRVSYISSVQELDGARYSNLVFGTDDGIGDRDEKMRISASGRVGIGHTKPGGHLHVSGLSVSIGDVTVTDSGPEVTGGTDLDTKISNGDRIKINGEIFTVSSVAATTLTLSDTPSTADTYEAFTDNNGLIVTNVGNVGIGTTNPAQKLHIVGGMRIGSSGNYENIVIENQTKFGNYEGVVAILPGTVPGSGASEMATYFKNASIVGSTRHDVLIDGRVGIGTTNPAQKLDVNGNIAAGTFYAPSVTTTQFGWNSTSNSTDSSKHMIFSNPNGNVGDIRTNGTATGFTTSSDYRLKENIIAINDAIDRIKQLKPSRFNFIADSETIFDGFLAHEVKDVVPEAVFGEKDALDENGDPDYQGIDQSKLVPLLTAAIQEQQQIIEDLKSQNASLESRISALES